MTTWRMADGLSLDISVVSFDGLAVVRQVFGGQGWLMGYTLTATAPATSAVAQLIDGSDVLGDPFALVRIPADTTTTHGPSVPGIPLGSGLTINPITAALSGSVTIGRLTT